MELLEEDQRKFKFDSVFEEEEKMRNLRKLIALVVAFHVMSARD